MERHELNIQNQKSASNTERIQKWPFSNTNAEELRRTDFRVLVSGDILTSKAFSAFYQAWTKCGASEQKLMFAPAIDLENAGDVSTFDKIKVLKYSDCNDYVSFFQYVKKMGSWIFLTENQEKAERIIKAARESGAFLRVYGLNNDGSLKNYKPSSVTPQTERDDAFPLSSQIAPIRRVIRKSQSVPSIGDSVYTTKNQRVVLRQEFSSNPQSITYSTDLDGMQVKIYQAQWLSNSYFEDKAKCMLEKPIICEGISWPTDMVYDKNGEFVGILVPEVKGYQLKQHLMSQQGLKESFPAWNRRNLTHLAKTIIDKIVYLQDRNVLFGLVNPNAIFVKDDSHVYFSEMDTYQINGFPILSYERVMQAPELQDISNKIRLYTKQEDNYEIALLVFMILMPGKFPYNKGNNKTISESIKKMSFAFRYGKTGEEHGARESFGLWRFAWSHLGNDLKQAFYNTFQSEQAFCTPERRRDARFWQRKLTDLENELIDPYDRESLEIFPHTFKRYSGTKTIHCEKCGIDHPAFYYRYPEKRICNSCLGQPSDVHFVCKTCGKSYYYDLGTLFKYERLVETKNFSMPTHCPYCRSDKKKCQGTCNEYYPAYKLNEKGLCYECAKRERDTIVKRYRGKCGHEIALTKGQVDFYMTKFGNLPQRCKQCKDNYSNGR